jgi:hypothetical protein
MCIRKAVRLALCAAALSIIFAGGARADDYNKKTVVTFTEPVQIPGQVLAPGTYVFMLLNSPANRNVVEIWNTDQNHLFASLETNSETHWPPPDRPIYTPDHSKFQLEEQRGGLMVLRSFYFPGYLEGQEFIYNSSSNAH